MKNFTLLLVAMLMISFSALAQIKMIVHLNDAEPIEVYASSVDSITFANFPVDPDDDDSDGPIIVDPDDEDLEIPEVEKPGRGKTTIVLYIPESDCEEAEPYILGVLDGYDKWSSEPDRAMESLGNSWWKVTLDALTAENATNFKFRMEDGFGGWSFYPIDSYELLEDAAEYIQIKDEEQNNLLAIASCDNKVLYIKSGKWSDTPCKAPIPAGHAKFIFTPTGYVPEGYDLIFTGNFEEKSWSESDRIMTKQEDGTYVWEGDYPENFQFKVIIKDAAGIGAAFDDGVLWLDGDNKVVEAESGSVIEFEGCFGGLCPGDEVDDDDTEVVISTPSGYHNSYGYVDLGLPSGTLWATMNVGADSPEDYGYYFAWGETEPKAYYDWDTYKWMTDGASSWSAVNKYTVDDGQIEAVWYDEYGNFIGDNKTVLELADDAANANWGGDWVMPTMDELNELRDTDNCTCTWTTQNGINGYQVTSKSNGNSIFLPAAGYRYFSDLYVAGSDGGYWSSSLSAGFSDNAYVLYFGSDGIDWSNNNRGIGRSVRPVLRVE